MIGNRGSRSKDRWCAVWLVNFSPFHPDVSPPLIKHARVFERFFIFKQERSKGAGPLPHKILIRLKRVNQ